MALTRPISVPPVTADFTSEMQRTETGLPPVQSAFRLTRAADGNTRLDSGNTSVISNPAAGQTILLNHIEKTATIQPLLAAASSPPGMPPMPQLGVPGFSPPPPAQVQDLGKAVLQGHEVEGKRYLIQPPAMPNIPAMPKPPAFQAPGYRPQASEISGPCFLPTRFLKWGLQVSGIRCQASEFTLIPESCFPNS